VIINKQLTISALADQVRISAEFFFVSETGLVVIAGSEEEPTRSNVSLAGIEYSCAKWPKWLKGKI
jgi:hypothetical protein